MGLFTLDSLMGKLRAKKDLVCRYGLMALSMLANGLRAKPMVMVDLF